MKPARKQVRIAVKQNYTHNLEILIKRLKRIRDAAQGALGQDR